MNRISSKYTFLFKRIFPTFWFGASGYMLLTNFFSVHTDKSPDIMSFVIPIIMAVFGYIFMKMFLFDLIDEVYDEGSSLLFKNGRQEVRVSLNEIKNISYSTFSSPPRVTINLRHKTILGKDLSFSPPESIIPFKKSDDIEKLIDRVDKARN